MNRNCRLCLLSILMLSGWLDLHGDEPTSATETAQDRQSVIAAPTTATEARARAMLLHETIRGALQVVHRDLFDDENPHAIPSASLEDVFDELAKSYGVKVKWLNVHTDMLNVDHTPEGEFEKRAASVIAKGKTQIEAIEQNRYRYVGQIRLASQCLKCHVKHRTTTDDRFAGLLITMPIAESKKQ